jgi:8-oxo-dGTP diphosphatase
MASLKDTNDAIALLGQDEIRNANMICFMRNYPVESVERIGDSLLVRGVSDRRWVYMSSSDKKELDVLVKRLAKDDLSFAAIEDWIAPAVIGNKAVVWDLPMVKLILPGHVTFQETYRSPISPLSADDVDPIYGASLYKAVTSPSYIRERIEMALSAGVRESGELVAWVMTHDDCSIGVMHVLDAHR